MGKQEIKSFSIKQLMICSKALSNEDITQALCAKINAFLEINAFLSLKKEGQAFSNDVFYMARGDEEEDSNLLDHMAFNNMQLINSSGVPDADFMEQPDSGLAS